MLEKGPKKTRNMITVLGVFKLDTIFSCLFGFRKKIGGGGEGGEAPSQMMRAEE